MSARAAPATLALLLSGALLASAASADLTPPPATPPPASAALTIEHAHGRPAFAIAGQRIVIRGTVAPFVPGQKVALSVELSGRLKITRTLTVHAGAHGTGVFRLAYRSRRRGVLTVTAEHAESPAMGAFRTRPLRVRFVTGDLSVGSTGPAVRLLQSQLSQLHYAVSRSGIFDDATARAVIAYRKLTGLARVANANPRLFQLLARRAGTFHVRYRHDGRHVEADLTRQVLAEVEPGGRVWRIYPISSGKPSTPTVVGRFHVYEKTPGVNAKGMVDSNYFLRGYAIHGYAEVPVFAASHGCLRVPIPDAGAIFAWVRVGTPVDVYH